MKVTRRDRFPASFDISRPEPDLWFRRRDRIGDTIAEFQQRQGIREVTMKFRMPMTAIAAALAASVAMPAAAAEIYATVVNGHPPVFLWVKHLTETFIPTVNKELEGTDYSFKWTEAYGGTLAAVGGELEAIEDGLAEIGAVPTVFEP